ncbi:MAG: FtsX-like permease family protein [Candidatus Paceibacterota bacterium]
MKRYKKQDIIDIFLRFRRRYPRQELKDILTRYWISFKDIISFVFLVMMSSFSILFSYASRKWPKLIPRATTFDHWVKSLDKVDKSSVSHLYIIEIAFKNMATKKTRTLITVGGMAIGISFIVFLVSVGYGLQQMVVSRVASLDELKQAEVLPGLSSDLSLTDVTINRFKEINNVTAVLPIIAAVGRISYQNSISDIAIYGATTDYLKYSALQPIKGTLFESNKISFDVATLGTVAGTSTEIGTRGDIIGKISYSIDADTWIKVHESPKSNGKVFGYTRRVEGNSTGTEVWGDEYTSPDSSSQLGTDSNGDPLGKWINAVFYLWEKRACNSVINKDCEDGEYLIVRDQDNIQVQQIGYIPEISTTVSPEVKIGQVLALTTDTTDGTLPLVEIASESASAQTQNVETVEVNSAEKKQIVVNRSVLQLLNINENDAVDKEIMLSMVIVGDLLDDPQKRIESIPIPYKIVGVIPDEGTPVIYVPFMDVRSLGVNKYSQMKVIVKDKNSLAAVRIGLESTGYSTTSVADTVSQIDNLFYNLRVILSIVGMVALAVAALGMFNTLTVSLLERTREVGLMKAMGMKSEEVKSLFLTESMIMGLYGGIFGLIIGIIAGKILSVVLSVFSLIKGVGFVDISYVPISYILIVLLLSIVVGIGTGYYPAKRATKISALNALRYE